MTRLREEFGSSQAKEILRNRAKILRSRLVSEHQVRFDPTPINLQALGPTTRLAFYEPGHVFGVRYEQSSLPTTPELIDDLGAMIDLYRLATVRGGTDELESDHSITDQPQVDLSGLTLQEKRQLRYHRVIERNPRLAAGAKQTHGYVCQVCDFDFETEYGSIGHGYIEAHHLTPISELPLDQPVQLSPKDDFRVVCANCHRMIHREGAPSTFEDFREVYIKQQGL